MSCFNLFPDTEMTKIYMVALLSFCVWIIHAQHDRSATVLRSAAKGLEYEVKAGFHIAVALAARDT